jgi:hypothetical protein
MKLGGSEWLHEAAQSPITNRVSSSRVIALVAALTLSFCTVVMTFGMFSEPEFALPLTTAIGLLGAMGGAGYMTNKIMNGKPEKTNGAD